MIVRVISGILVWLAIFLIPAAAMATQIKMTIKNNTGFSLYIAPNPNKDFTFVPNGLQTLGPGDTFNYESITVNNRGTGEFTYPTDEIHILHLTPYKVCLVIITLEGSAPPEWTVKETDKPYGLKAMKNQTTIHDGGTLNVEIVKNPDYPWSDCPP